MGFCGLMRGGELGVSDGEAWSVDLHLTRGDVSFFLDANGVRHAKLSRWLIHLQVLRLPTRILPMSYLQRTSLSVCSLPSRSLHLRIHSHGKSGATCDRDARVEPRITAAAGGEGDGPHIQ